MEVVMVLTLSQLLSEIKDESLQGILRGILFHNETKYNATVAAEIARKHRPELKNKDLY